MATPQILYIRLDENYEPDFYSSKAGLITDINAHWPRLWMGLEKDLPPGPAQNPNMDVRRLLPKQGRH